MQYFDKDHNIIKCPYGIHFLDRYLTSDKSATVVPLCEYQGNYNTDIVIAYEWSGFTQIPATLPPNHYVLYFDFTLKNNNIIYYPHWLFFTAEILEQFVEVNTTYPVACASRNFNNYRPGKIYNYQQLKNKNYFKQILITKYKSIEQFDTVALTNSISKEMLAEFLLDYDKWEQLDYDELDLINSMTVLDIPVYKESLFHLVAETTVEEYLISEKTFKIFLTGQIPIVCGPQYAVKHLRELGFDMFDDIVDHHRYDDISDWCQRIDTMQTCVDEIMNLNHNSLREYTKDRRIKNFNHLKSKELHNLLLQPIADIIT